MTYIRRLLIVSHVPHFRHEGRLCAYGPYAREIDIWADLFPEVVIAAPLRREEPPRDAIPFTRQNISVTPQLETGGNKPLAKLVQVLALPTHLWRLGRAMSHADAIHVRCPGNLGLLGCFLAPFFRKPCVAKYAGQWNKSDSEPPSWSWQKRLLCSKLWNAPVLVYGNWPNQPSHIVPFFTSILSDHQMTRARRLARRDFSQRPIELLFTGRLSAGKNVDVIIKALASLRQEGLDLRLRVVGDGHMRRELQLLANSLRISDRVLFEGAVPQDRVLDFYERAQILVLASQTEGWPKTLAEGMAFGLACIGSNRGLIPQMLSEGRGLLVEPGDVMGLKNALKDLAAQPEKAKAISERAAAWGQQFTLEGLRSALKARLESAWGVKLQSSASVKMPSAVLEA